MARNRLTDPRAGDTFGYAEHELFVVAVSDFEIVASHNLSGEFQVYTLERWAKMVVDTGLFAIEVFEDV